jgi:hypothetical protein
MALAFHPDGKKLVTGHFFGVAVWDVATGKALWNWKSPGGVDWLAWADDGRHLILHNANRTVYVLRLSDLTGAVDRTVAEWVLSIGGQVKLRDATGDRHVAARADLPAGPFSLFGVMVGGKKAVITDAALKNLTGLTGLKELELYGTDVTDAGLERLKEFPQLASIHLGGTSVGDAGLGHLKELVLLSNLDLGGTRVTDAGLEHLKGLTKLDYVRLSGTKVTADGVAKLQKALPKCKIEWEPPPE